MTENDDTPPPTTASRRPADSTSTRAAADDAAIAAALDPEPRPDPADFPLGFWRRLDFMLHHSEWVRAALRDGVALRELSRFFLVATILMAALYGAVMGATNLLQGADMSLNAKFSFLALTSAKVPVLFLLTLVIIFPPVYISNAFMGAKMSVGRMVTLLLGTMAVTATLLASMATVSAFFSLTSRSYHFIKLLHVLFFGYAGIIGLAFLSEGLDKLGRQLKRRTPTFLLLGWLLLYMFVGTQLAWVLRPFVGGPGRPFEIFRERQGNFYESVLDAVGNFLDDIDD